MRPTRLTLGLTTNDPTLLARVAETLARALAGLAMEGVDATLMVYEDETSETPSD